MRVVHSLSSLAIALVGCFSDPPPAEDDDTTGEPTSDDSDGSVGPESGDFPPTTTSPSTSTDDTSGDSQTTEDTQDTGSTGTPETCGNGSAEPGELCLDQDADFEVIFGIPVSAIGLGMIDGTPGDGAFLGNNGDDTFTNWWLWDGNDAGPQIQGENTNIGAPAPVGVVMGDLDGDMDSDAVFGSALQLTSLLPFDMEFTSVTCPFAPAVADFTLAQIDDDSQLEPVVALGGPEFGLTAWLIPDTECSTENQPFDTKTQFVAALERSSGTDDVVVGGDQTNLWVGAIGEDPFHVVELFLHDLTDAPLHMSAGDFDGEGVRNDLVVATNEGITVLLRTDEGFEQSPFLQAGGVVNAMAVADLDSDGDDDVVIADDTSTTITLLLSSGPGMLDYVEGPNTGASNTAVAAADTNDDLAADIVVGDDEGVVRWFLANP